MRYSEESRMSIKRRVEEGTGLSFDNRGRAAARRRLILAALAAVLILSTAAVYAARQFGISRQCLMAPQQEEPAAGGPELSETSGQSGEITAESAAKANEAVQSGYGRINGFRISAPFAYNENEYSASRYAHKGIDFAAPKGTPVLAAAAGTVRLSEYSPSYGYHIIIDHEDGFSTLYAHMESLTAGAGQQVEAGEQIGTVGSSGMSTGPHLHLELRIDDEPVDPSEYWE